MHIHASWTNEICSDMLLLLWTSSYLHLAFRSLVHSLDSYEHPSPTRLAAAHGRCELLHTCAPISLGHNSSPCQGSPLLSARSWRGAT